MLPITWTTKPPLCHEDLERWKTTLPRKSRSAGLLSAQKKSKTDLVSIECRDKTLELKKPAGARWKKGSLEDTIYSEEPDVVDEWGEFYLPEIVRMKVEGVVEGISCPSDQLVLMTCEDGKLFAYDGAELHLVASSMKQLREEGIRYPGYKRYYKGEAFKDMTEKDWAKAWNSRTGRALVREHHKQVLEHKAECMEYLRVTAAIQESLGKPPGQSVTSLGPNNAHLSKV